MVNDKNHLYSKDDYQKDLKDINKVRASQGFSRFSTAQATSLNDAGNTQAPEAMQIATRDGHFRPINDTFGSFGAVTIDVFVGTKPSGGRSAVTYNIYELTDDTTFTFSGTPSGKMLPVTLDFTINKTAPEPVITWNSSVENPPVLTGLLGNGTRHILHFETINDGTNERQVYVGGTFSAAGGVGSQTPWLSDIDADGYDLFDLSNLIFRTSTGPPTGQIGIWHEATGLHYNTLAAQSHIWQINDFTEMSLNNSSLLMDSVDLDMNSNIITQINDAVWIQDAGLPLGSVNYIAANTTHFLFNAPTGDAHRWTINAVPRMTMSNTSLLMEGIDLDMNSNIITQINDAVWIQDGTLPLGSVNYIAATVDNFFINAPTGDVISLRINGTDFFTVALAEIDAHTDINMNTGEIFNADRYTLSTIAAASSILDKGMYSFNANGGVGINSPVDGLGSKFTVTEEEVEKFTVDHVGDNVLVIDYTFNVNDSVAGNNYSINHLSVNTLISSPNKITYNIGAANQYEQTDGLITFIGAKGIIANIDQLGFRTLGNIIQDTATTMLYSVVPGGEHIFGDGTLVFMDLDTSRAVFDDFYFDFLSRTSPGVTGAANRGRLFMDSANAHHVSVIRNGSVIDLEAGGGVQTPWASNIDAAGFNLFGVGSITLTEAASANVLNFVREDTSTGIIGNLLFTADSDLGNPRSYVSIVGRPIINTDLAEQGRLILRLIEDGVPDVNFLELDGENSRIEARRQLQMIGASIDMNVNDIINAANVFINSNTTHTLDFFRLTPQADDYVIGSIQWRHNDQGGIPVNYAKIEGVMAEDGVAAAEEGAIIVSITSEGVHDFKVMTINENGDNNINLYYNINFASTDDQQAHIDNVNNLTFREVDGSPAGSIPYIEKELATMNFNVPTGDGFDFTENNVQNVNFDGNGKITARGGYGFISGTGDITASASLMSLDVDAGDSFEITEAGVQFVLFDGVSNACLFSRDIEMDDGAVYQAGPGSGDVCGFLVTNNASPSVGTFGTLQVPFDTLGDSSAAQADSDFGAFLGAIGIYGRSGSDPFMCFRVANGDWEGLIFNLTLT